MKHLINIDRRVIYILVFLSILIPLFVPINLPIEATGEIVKFYNEIEKLKQGDVVLVSFNYSISGQAEINPQADIVMEHLLSKEGIKVIGASFRTDSLLMLDEYFEKRAVEYNKVYGVDYVNLGFIFGGEAAMANLGKDVHMTAPEDYHKNLITEIEMMKNVKTGADFDLIIDFSGGTPGTPEMIRQLVDPYNVPYIVGTLAVSVVANLPYYASGQMDGYLNSLVGAAGYEKLMGVKGAATEEMDPLSFSVIIVLVLIVFGNVTYFIDKKNTSKGSETNDR